MAMPYHGRVEYGASGTCVVEIDDLDAPEWEGRPSGAFLIGGNRSYPWFLGVVLLEGPRAGEFATADLFVDRGPSRKDVSVRFGGRSAFAPHPEFVDVEASRRRFEELRSQAPVPPPEIGDYADREPELSVLERPPRRLDRLVEPLRGDRMPVRPDSVRLAFNEGDRRVYVAEGTDEDSLFLIYSHVGGAGASGGPRSNLARYGLTMMTSQSSAGDDVIVGVVPDDVIAVHLDGLPALMGENVFVAEHGSRGRTLTLTTADGQRHVPLGTVGEQSG